MTQTAHGMEGGIIDEGFGFGRRSASKGSKANGRSRKSTSQYPFIWMAALKPQSTLLHSWAAAVDRMNNGKTGQSNRENNDGEIRNWNT
jgi:hypothetical protein